MIDEDMAMTGTCQKPIAEDSLDVTEKFQSRKLDSCPSASPSADSRAIPTMAVERLEGPVAHHARIGPRGSHHTTRLDPRSRAPSTG